MKKKRKKPRNAAAKTLRPNDGGGREYFRPYAEIKRLDGNECGCDVTYLCNTWFDIFDEILKKEALEINKQRFNWWMYLLRVVEIIMSDNTHLKNES